jgi:hypothetical protein
MAWDVFVTYGIMPFTLKADLEYHSNQVMRIRVHGKNTSLLLENNYPALRLLKSKKGIKWKIREGAMKEGTPETARLLVHIMEELETIIKSEFPAEY